LGIALATAGRFDDAMRCYERALLLQPDHAPTLHAMAGLFLLRGDKAQALDRYRAATAADPRHADARLMLGVTLCELGRLDEADAELRTAQRLAPQNPQVPYALGLVAKKQQQPAAARAQFERALALDPAFAPARQELGTLPPR